MKIGEEYSTDSEKMAKHFKKYFGTIAKNLDKRIPKSKFSEHLKNQNLTPFLLIPVTGKEIRSIIISLNARKATGHNSISNFVLKEFKEGLKKPLTIITNMFLLLESLPEREEKPTSFRLIKKEINQNALTTEQFLYYQTSVK